MSLLQGSVRTAWPPLFPTAPSPVHQCLLEDMELVTPNSVANKVCLCNDCVCDASFRICNAHSIMIIMVLNWILYKLIYKLPVPLSPFYPYNTTMKPGAGGWSPSDTDRYQWLQVDLGSRKQVVAVATQGRYSSSDWTSKYRLLYSDTQKNWRPYLQDGNIWVKNILSHV